jgi:hypothetical protein
MTPEDHGRAANGQAKAGRGWGTLPRDPEPRVRFEGRIYELREARWPDYMAVNVVRADGTSHDR